LSEITTQERLVAQMLKGMVRAMRHYRKRKNPTALAKGTLYLMAFGGLALFLTVFAMRNMNKVKTFVSSADEVNKKLEVLLPALQKNAEKLTNISKSIIPKEASTVAKMLQF
jgi:predicted PurR-regulated permease PerM